MSTITLNCGRTVLVDSVHISSTYGPMTEGAYCEENNNKMIMYARKNIERIWGKRPTVMIPPTAMIPSEPHPATPDEQYLPGYYFAVWLMSDEPLDKKNYGSELVVIWFGSIKNETRIEQMIQEAVQPFSWDTVAGDHEG